MNGEGQRSRTPGRIRVTRLKTIENTQQLTDRSESHQARISAQQMMHQTMRQSSKLKKINRVPDKNNWLSGDQSQLQDTQYSQPQKTKLQLMQEQLAEGKRTANIIKYRKLPNIQNQLIKQQQQSQVMQDPNSYKEGDASNLMKDSEGNSFMICSRMEKDLLLRFINNDRDIQIKKNHQYQHVINTAEQLGLKTKDEFLHYSEILLQALQSCILNGQKWYCVMYWLSKQYYFWCGATKEKIVYHPMIEEYKKQISEKKMKDFTRLPLIKKDYVETFIELREEGIPLQQLRSEEDRLQYEQYEKAAKDMQILSSIEQMRKCSNILYKCCVPPVGCQVVRKLLQKKKIVFYIEDQETTVDTHPLIQQYMREIKENIKNHRYELPEVVLEDIELYLRKKWVSQDKKDIFDKFYQMMGFNNMQELDQYRGQYWKTIKKMQ